MEACRFTLADLITAAAEARLDVSLRTQLYLCLNADGTGRRRIDEIRIVRPAGRRRASIVLLPAYRSPADDQARDKAERAARRGTESGKPHRSKTVLAGE